MSYSYTVIKDSPKGFWPLDHQVSGSLLEVSGYSSDATVVSASDTKPVVAQGLGSQLITSGGVTINDQTLFYPGTQYRPFTLECWYRAENSTGSATVFGRGSSLVNISDKISVTINMSTPITLSSRSLIVGKNYHIAVVYDTSSISLFVNSVQEDSVIVSSDDLIAGFSDSGNLTFSAVGGKKYSIGAIAVYPYAMRASLISYHYLIGTTYLSVDDININRLTTRFKFSDNYSDINTQAIFNDLASWSLGQITDEVTVADDSLVNGYDSSAGNYGAGTWQYHIYIPPQTNVIDSSRITWVGDSSVAIDYSLNNGSTWTTAINGGTILGTSSDVSAGKDIIIRVTFSSGTDQSVIYSLDATFYNSRNVTSVNSAITASINPSESGQSLSEYDYEPTSFEHSNGLNVTGAASRVVISPNATLGNYRAIEFTIREGQSPVSKTILSGNSAGTQPTITTNSSGQWVSTNLTALYIDGSPVSTTTPVTVTSEVTHHVVAVFAAFADSFYLLNNSGLASAPQSVIGYISMHYATLSASDVLTIYNAWIGNITQRINDVQTITFQEHDVDTSTPFRAYSYIWSS